MNERRRFNSAERVALYLAADGRCKSCGTGLGPGWHADHEIPYSAGGPTDVINGQALCPACNLTKGDNFMELRKWQSDALTKLLTRDEDFLCVATPGAGKTTFALTAAKKLIDRSEVRRIIAVVPTSHLRGQWKTAAAKLGIQLDDTFVNKNGAVAADYDGPVVTYATVVQEPALWRHLATRQDTLIILDEIHHAGEDDKLRWGPALKAAFEPARRRLLLSGTPFRTDRTPIPFVRYDQDRECVPSYNYDYGQALFDRTVVRPIAFSALNGEARWRDAGSIRSAALADADDETLSKALAGALLPEGDWIPSVLRQANDELTRHRIDTPDAGGLIVAPGQPEARAYAKILHKITGEDAVLATSDEPDASRRISEFAGGSARWIVAVQMVSEGVDIPRLSVGVYASRTKTEMFFRQVAGRFVRMRDEYDETFATLFIPSIQPLLKYAADIEKTVNAVLAEEECQIRREVKERGSQTALQFDLVEPLGSSEAIHYSTILSGESFSDEELRYAESILQGSSGPASASPAWMARALRLAGHGKVVGTVTVTPEAAQPLADEKKSLRRLLGRKVGMLNKLTNVPHSHIHTKLNQHFKDTVKTATSETLQQRLDVVGRWIEAERA